MIYLITGVPGAGKTLRAVWWIEKFVKEGREVYADIDGMNIPAVLPGVEDWRETPDGSVVVYDECQQQFGPDKGQGRSSNEVIAAFEVHRHTGHDIVLITQHPNLLHAHIRRLVGRHEHLTRAFGLGRAMIYGRDELITGFTPSALKQCESQLWKHPKRLFQLYHSASEHTHKRRIPWKILGMAGVVLVGLPIVVYKILQVDPTDITGIHTSLANANAAGGVEVVDPRPGGTYETVHAQTVGGCVATSTRCMCFGPDMVPLDQDEDACRAMEAKPLPIVARIGGAPGKGSPTSAPAEGRTPSPGRPGVAM